MVSNATDITEKTWSEIASCTMIRLEVEYSPRDLSDQSMTTEEKGEGRAHSRIKTCARPNRGSCSSASETVSAPSRFAVGQKIVVLKPGSVTPTAHCTTAMHGMTTALACIKGS